jgi:hypothetical protein
MWLPGFIVKPYAAVPWQFLHPVATATLAWNLAGVQPVKLLWQVPQVAVVEMWLASFPVAACPLWQVAQLVAIVKVLWSAFAPVHVVVDLWQVSQPDVV